MFKKLGQSTAISVLLFSCLLNKWLCFAFAASPETVPSNSYHKPIPSGVKFWAWTNEKWTGDDKPYQLIRTQIDAAVARGVDTKSLVTRYQILAEQHPSDPKPQFARGYAAYKAATNPKLDLTTGQGYLSDAYRGLALVPSPHAYNFTRLRFLRDAHISPFPELAALGKRLLQHTPHDYDVEYYESVILSHSHKTQDQEKGLAYGDKLAREYPDRPAVLGLIGSIYYVRWQQKKDKRDGEKAISAYQRYLQIAPLDFAFRSQAKILIAALQHG